MNIEQMNIEQLKVRQSELVDAYKNALNAVKSIGVSNSQAAKLLNSPEFLELQSEMGRVNALLEKDRVQKESKRLEAVRAENAEAAKDPEGTLKKLQSALKKAQGSHEKAVGTHQRMEAHLAVSRDAEVKAAEALERRSSEELEALLNNKELPAGPDLMLAQAHAQRAAKVAAAAVQKAREDRDATDAARREAERELRMHQHMMDNLERKAWAESALKTWIDHGGKDAQALIQTLKNIHGGA